MNLNLTSKEKLLLEDQKKHEEICIQKYSNYADLASDQQLKDIFNNHAKKEQEHLNTINQLLSGQVPALNNQQGGANANQQQSQQQQSSQQQQFQQQQTFTNNVQTQGNPSNFLNSDQSLCNDLLMTEKYVSGTYDTAIFEFRNPQVRDVLNHIQKEEQKHGETIYQYMESKGMYSPK